MLLIYNKVNIDLHYRINLPNYSIKLVFIIILLDYCK